MSDDFKDDGAMKEYALNTPAYLLDKLLLRIMRREFDDERGFVTWNAETPAGTPWAVHLNSFMGAVYTALQFAETDFTGEWLFTGSGGMYTLRMLHDFVLFERPVKNGDLWLVGSYKRIQVYFSYRVPSNEFYAGCGQRFARGMIRDMHFTVPNSIAERAGTPMWRALTGAVEPEPPRPPAADDPLPDDPWPDGERDMI